MAVQTQTEVVSLPTWEGSPVRRIRWYSPRNLVRALLPVTLLVLWQVLSVTEVIASQTIPSPTVVLDALWDLIRTGELTDALAVSLSRSASGLAIGLAVGITAGTLNGLSKRAEELFDSSFQAVRLIPFIAMVPLFIVWFGIGEEFKVVVIALACVFPVYLNTYAGVRHVDPKLVEAGQVFGLSRFQSVRQIILPAARPEILVGVRYSMGTSLLALVLAEQVNASSGIGQIISIANSALRIDIIVAAIVVYAVLGLLVDVIMRVLERLLIPWK